MTTAWAPRELASASGIVVAEDGRHVLVYDRGLGPLGIATFVLGLMALIGTLQAGIFGALAAGESGTFPPALPLAMGAGALVALLSALLLGRRLRQRMRTPLLHLVPVVAVDRHDGRVVDGSGRTLGRVVGVEARLRATSSSRSLVLVHDRGTVLLGRPSPFLGGLGGLDHVLRAALGLP